MFKSQQNGGLDEEVKQLEARRNRTEKEIKELAEELAQIQETHSKTQAELESVEANLAREVGAKKHSREDQQAYWEDRKKQG